MNGPHTATTTTTTTNATNSDMTKICEFEQAREEKRVMNKSRAPQTGNVCKAYEVCGQYIKNMSQT